MANEITTPEQLEAEFKRLGGPTTESDGWTVREFCEAWKCSDGRVRTMLQRADKLGVLRHGQKSRRQINSVIRFTDCYWFEFPKRGKK